MSLFLLDVAAGPVIIVAAIILLVIAGLMIGLVYLAVRFIKKIKKEEDKKLNDNDKK
jgi:hypothetical protein